MEFTRDGRVADPTRSAIHPAVNALLRYFEYSHLPEPLQAVSLPFHRLAYFIGWELPQNAETTTALRKLLEAKDCAVRAALD